MFSMATFLNIFKEIVMFLISLLIFPAVVIILIKGIKVKNRGFAFGFGYLLFLLIWISFSFWRDYFCTSVMFALWFSNWFWSLPFLWISYILTKFLLFLGIFNSNKETILFYLLLYLVVGPIFHYFLGLFLAGNMNLKKKVDTAE